MWGEPLVEIMCSGCGAREIAQVQRRPLAAKYVPRIERVEDEGEHSFRNAQSIDLSAETDPAEMLRAWCDRCHAWYEVSAIDLAAKARAAPTNGKQRMNAL